MKVKVKLFATLARHIPETVRVSMRSIKNSSRPFEVDLPDGSSVADLLNHLDLPGEEFKVAFVNGRARPLDSKLNDGDDVGIFPPIGGG